MSVYVPRFGTTNIVYDTIPANHILTTTNSGYSSVQINNGVLTKSNNALNFKNPEGILYGNGNWSLESIPLSNGMLIQSRNKQSFKRPQGMLYGSGDDNTWDISAVPIKNGILVNENSLAFKSPSGIIYCTDVPDWSVKSIPLDYGLLTNTKNDGISFTTPTNILYGKNTAGIWSLEHVNDITPDETSDYVLYYKNNIPQWKVLTITGKNFAISGDTISGQWKTLVINPNTNNIVAVPTETIGATEYGVFNNAGKVVKLSSSIMNQLGFKFFSPSEINEQGILTANIILYNNSAINVEFPVNYFSCLNYHSDNINSNIANTTYTKGYYNFSTVQNGLPYYDTINNTYNGFYSYINANNISDGYYIHYVTSLFIDSIQLPIYNSNYSTVNEYGNVTYYNNSITSYKLVIGVYTNFSNIKSNWTFYNNIFFCNQTTPVMSTNDDNVLLGYIIVKCEHNNYKITVNKQFDIDSTIPIYRADNIDLHNGILSFRPLFYINNNNKIISLHYDNKVKASNFIQKITQFDETGLYVKTTGSNTVQFTPDMFNISNGNIYFNTNDVMIDNNHSNMYTVAEKYLSRDQMTNIFIDTTNANTSKFSTTYTYADTANNTVFYPRKYFFEPYSYVKVKYDYCTSDLLGYTQKDDYFAKVYLIARPNVISDPVYILNNSVYASNNGGIYNQSTPSTYLITNSNAWTTVNGYINVKQDGLTVDSNNNVCNGSNVLFTYGTYIDRKLSVDDFVLYIDSNTSNVHTCISKIPTAGSNIQYLCKCDVGVADVDMFLVQTGLVVGSSHSSDKILANSTTFNSNMYTITNDDVYDQQYMLSNDYIHKQEILLENGIVFNYTSDGVLYDERIIFNNKETRLNEIGQIVLNSEHYEYGIDENGIYIKNKAGNVIIQSPTLPISNNQHIEITNSNFYTAQININNANYTKLCKKTGTSLVHIGLKYQPATSASGYEHLATSTTVAIGDHSYGNGSNNRNIFLSNSISISTTSDVAISTNNVIHMSVNNTSNANSIILSQTGLYKCSDYIMQLNSNHNIVYTDTYTELPFFDVPVESSIKVILEPITKYSIISYNTQNYDKNIYTLSKDINYKISVCNINATITSYVGEYPSLIY